MSYHESSGKGDRVLLRFKDVSMILGMIGICIYLFSFAKKISDWDRALGVATEALKIATDANNKVNYIQGYLDNRRKKSQRWTPEEE